MALDDENTGFGLGQGCDVHGEDHMRECNMCGAEFCRRCFPRSAVCPDCAEQADEGEEKEGSDFEDVENLDEVLGKDEEAERLISESEEEPPPGELQEEGDREP